MSPHCHSWYNRLQYQGTEFHFSATAGTTGCSTKGLSVHYNSWYNRLQYQGTECHLTATAGTTGCSTKGLSVTSLLIWYNRLQYQRTQSHVTVMNTSIYIACFSFLVLSSCILLKMSVCHLVSCCSVAYTTPFPQNIAVDSTCYMYVVRSEHSKVLTSQYDTPTSFTYLLQL